MAKNIIVVALSMLVGVALLSWSIDRLPLVPQTWPSLTIIAAYAAMVGLSQSTRALRWHDLMRPVGTMSLSRSLPIAFAGFMWIAVIPFRLGELARPVLVARHSEIRGTQTASSIVIERLMDAVVLSSLILLSASETTSTATGIYEGAQGLAIALLCIVATISGLCSLPMITRNRVVTRLLGSIPLVGDTLADKIRLVVSDTLNGFRALASASAVLRFVALSVVYWTLNAASLMYLSSACGFELHIGQAATVMSLAGLALLLPSAPAQIGAFQFGVTVALSLYLSADELVAVGSTFGFVMYAGQLGVIVTLGLLSHLYLRIAR